MSHEVETSFRRRDPHAVAPIASESLDVGETVVPPRDDWQPPISLTTTSTPEFPVDSLPGQLRDFAVALATATQTPVDAAALFVIAVCAVVLQKKVEVEVRPGWREQLGIDSDATHTDAGAPLAMPLHAIEACVGDYVLQVDSDLLVGRADPSHDYLGEMIDALEADPGAVTASLNVSRAADLAFSFGQSGEPWRVEVRGCLLHRRRLLPAQASSRRSRGAPSRHRGLGDARASGGAGARSAHPGTRGRSPAARS
jgi:hypothetical protein